MSAYQMNSRDFAKIMSNYRIIVDNVDFNEIKDYLYSNIDDFSSEDMEKIDKKETKPAKMRCLVETLMGKTSPDVLRYFCEALRDSEVKAYATLADFIDNADTSVINTDFMDAPYDTKINKLGNCCIKQTDILLNNMPLSEVPEFKQLSRSGELVVNETIEEFSKGIKLKFKKPSTIKDIACNLGVDALSDFSSAPTNEYITAMRKLVHDVNKKTLDELSNLIKTMHVLEMVGYATVESIARELYAECNWGRIVIWFAFWKVIAGQLEGNSEEYKTFGKYVGFHLASKCEKWITENGGWDHILIMAGNRNQGFFSNISRYLLRWFRTVL